MRRTIKFILFLYCLAGPQLRCIDKYNSPYTSPKTGYLVVEGYISGNTPTQFTLSRTIPLPGDSTVPMETGAKVQVEGNDNSVYPLTEQSIGVYGTSDTLALNLSTQYRLRISTMEGEQYLSGYAAVTPTPPIDSTNWVYNSDGVTIYANTHDPAGKLRYFQWNYTETWQYNSAEPSGLIYDPEDSTVIARPPDQDISTCWITVNSTNILLGSSAKLAQAEIYEQPLTLIQIGTVRLSVLYTILVRQYALTVDAYNFLSLMKQNTESLGSIFDATPSQAIGNIQCLTNPGEPVIGYVSAGLVQQERIYISRSQVPDWPYINECPAPDSRVKNLPDSVAAWFGSAYLIPTTTDGANYFLGNNVGCVDCRSQGGTTQKPSWWPN